MEPKEEIVTVFGQCACCLQFGYLKHMWTEHNWEGEQEIYGDMLHETFGIACQSSSNSDHICEYCIKKLRAASKFKKDMLSREDIRDNFNNEDAENEKQEQAVIKRPKNIKSEDLDKDHNLNSHEGDNEGDSETMDPDEDDNLDRGDDEEDIFDEETLNEETLNEETLNEEMLNEDTLNEEMLNEETLNEEMLDEDASMQAFEEIEYLEEDAEVVEKSVKTKVTETSDSDFQPKTWIRGKKGALTRYKNYSSDDLKRCVDAVISQSMTQVEAAKAFNIPSKTLNAQIRKIKKQKEMEIPDAPEDKEKNAIREKHDKFIEEIQTILTLTTCMPFKVKAARYYCPYCYLYESSFEDPNALRKHMESHGQEYIANIDRILRPIYMHEVFRVDVTNLKCKACFENLPGWNEMFQHFHDIHNVDFEQAYTKLIPYKLDNELQCALCNEIFPNFVQLDVHMNGHYSNYMCPSCGDTFVSESRLKKHVEIHENGKFACNECGKIFTLKKYRAKHISMHHKKEKVFKCVYCSESFTSDHSKQNHVVEKHPEKIKTITCEVCGKIFNWRHTYLKHCRTIHNEKRFECNICPKLFKTNYDLKLHILRHTGEGSHVCAICDKRYATMPELRSHLRVHIK